MKPLEIISALPQWANAAPGAILDSQAFAMPCRLGDESTVLRHAGVLPAGAETMPLSITFGDEPHTLSLARSSRFPDLDRLWPTRADVPEAILLALVERECGSLLQMLENAVRRQLRLNGLAHADAAADGTARADIPSVSFELGDPPAVFTLTRSDTVASAMGVLRNLDLSHEEIRSQPLPAVCEYAAFALGAADIVNLAPGDALLLPEIGTLAPRLVVDGRFTVDTNGVLPYAEDALVRVRAAAGRTMPLGELFDASEEPPVQPAAEPGLQLCLVKGGRLVASGRLDRLADQFAFVVEAVEPLDPKLRIP